MNSQINLLGTWDHQSFLVKPTLEEWEAKPDTPVTAEKWAKGTLTISESEGDQVLGELVFPPDITLSVHGRILPATEMLPAVLEATGKVTSEAVSKGVPGAVYQITGWIIFDPIKEIARPTIRGSILAVTPDLGGEPSGTVGAFVLRPV
ncbi:MAG: hypothetical protein IGS38_00915 [Synechococcales cyanobacterium M58_A2018_015]|nr:hypothetical protein [Synechococcales cyanobacterium M58_A2018_015]